MVFGMIFKHIEHNIRLKLAVCGKRQLNVNFRIKIKEKSH